MVLKTGLGTATPKVSLAVSRRTSCSPMSRPATCAERYNRPVLRRFSLLLPLALAHAQNIVVDSAPGHELNTFSPLRAMGSAVDRDPEALPQIYSQSNLSKMLAAGYGTLTYRLNTELQVQAWHWNPNGTWSDPSGQGYFTGNAAPGSPITQSYGYALPHRGFTIGGEPASALDDGDFSTYWKSNPYLTHAFTQTSDAVHPQWVLFDLGAVKGVDAVRIHWAAPFATAYEVQYWTGNDAIYNPAQGQWITFPAGTVTNADGGTVTLKLSPSPIPVRYVRVSMSVSSNTCDTHGASDIRNCVGYAIFEMGVGTLATGDFTDLVTHAPHSGKQTPTYCSSSDPWHTPSDIYPGDGDQPGLDFIFAGPLTRGLPAVVPVSLLYGVPNDAANEIAYLESRHYNIGWVELGEEPDGQFVLPEDDAELYLQWAEAIHRVDPSLKLGGPVFQGTNYDTPVWPDSHGNTSWFNRFLAYLQSHGRLNDLAFMSFEHYPFNPCQLGWQRLYQEPALVQGIVDIWKLDGLPAGVPMLITESNISYNTNESYMDVFGGLWVADYFGSALSAGVQNVFYYQYEALPMYPGCPNSWGAFSMFTVDSNYQIRQPSAQYHAAHLLTQQWAQPVDAAHQLYPATSDVKDAQGNLLVTAYPLFRPDGQWSVMLVNKNETQPETVAVAFREANGADNYFAGPVAQISFGAAQYVWLPNGANGTANPDDPAAGSRVPGGKTAQYTLPPASITVLRGTLQLK